jgi:carboxypeptidase Taq
MTTSTPLDTLRTWLDDIHHISAAYHVLYWDQNVMMPPRGASARAAQMGVLQRLRHERLTSDHTRTLLEAAKAEVNMDDFESDEASLIRVAERDIAYASQLPTDFVARYTALTADAFTAWKSAKANNDFASFAPFLERLMETKLQEADLRGNYEHPYDVLLGAWERGLTVRQTQAIFDAHRPALIDLVALTQANADKVNAEVLHQPFNINKQRELSLLAARAIGVDFDQWATFHEAPHPFCLQVGKYDIRITTRYNPNFFNPAFFGTLHESGHGLHGQGIAEHLDGTYLSDMESYSQAVAESQSRTWENLVGRSRAFWEWFFPQAQAIFPEQFANATPETIYQAVNRSYPQYSRVEADELTYNLHIMLRFEIERQWVEGKLRVQDLPDAWNDTFKQYFGITPQDDAHGVLQDVHWSVGGIGAFVGYALGNLLASQYYAVALQDGVGTPEQISRGEFQPLHTWLTEKIYAHGGKFTADELTRRVTGDGINPSAYVAYLREKFGTLYE